MIKEEMFNLLYQEGDVNVMVDTNADGVKVPAHLYGKPTNFVVGAAPSPLLEANDEGIIAPLRFGGDKFVCFFPWPSVRALVSPKAIVNFPGEEEDVESPEKLPKEPRKKGPSLKIVK